MTRKAIKKADATRSSGTQTKKTVRVGLHGLGKVLHAIHSKPALRKRFEKHMRPPMVVTLDASTAKRLKAFVSAELNHHDDDCDCDPRTDPYCICF